MCLETPEYCDVHCVLPVEAYSCITSTPYTKLVDYYVGLTHFAANAIRWADDHQLNKEEKTGQYTGSSELVADSFFSSFTEISHELQEKKKQKYCLEHNVFEAKAII